MNCLIVVPSLLRAGAETQAVNLANGLSARGHTVHLCCFERFLDQRERISEAVRFHPLIRRSKLDPFFLSQMANLIDREAIDVVQGVLQIAYLAAWLASNQSKRKPPVVAGIHTTVNRGAKQEFFDRLLYRRTLRKSAGIIFVCQHQKEYWLDRFPELAPLSTVVYNGIEPEEFRREQHLAAGYQLRADLKIPEDAVVFACIAAFRPEKGHDLLIDAFSKVPGGAFLLLAGDGEQRRLVENRVVAMGLREQTRFLGMVKDARPVMTASNATLLASTAVETFSMAMLESMALGVPMIAPRIGGLPEAISDRESGFLFPVGGVEELARCMTSVVERPHDAAKLGQAAARAVAERFTEERMVSETERKLLGASRVFRQASGR